MDAVTEKQIQEFPPHAEGRNALYRLLASQAFLFRDEKDDVFRVALASTLDTAAKTQTVYLVDQGVEFRKGEFTDSLYVPTQEVETRLLLAALNDRELLDGACKASMHGYSTVVCDFLQSRYVFSIAYQPDITSAWLELTLRSYQSPDYHWEHRKDDPSRRPSVPHTVRVLSKVAFQAHIQRMITVTT